MKFLFGTFIDQGEVTLIPNQSGALRGLHVLKKNLFK